MGLKEHILFRNRITREIKKVYYKNSFQDNINNMKNLWLGIKNILNINKKEYLSHLSHNGKNINNNLDMANSFKLPKLNKQIPYSNILRNPNVYLPPRILYSISLYHSTPKEISEIISEMIPNHQVLHLFLSNY